MNTPAKPTPLSGGADLTVARRHRLGAWLAATDLDAVICCGLENIHYATGYRSTPGGHRRNQRMAAVVTPAQTTLVGPYAELPAAIAAGVDPTDYIGYGTSTSTMSKTTPQSVRSNGTQIWRRPSPRRCTAQERSGGWAWTAPIVTAPHTPCSPPTCLPLRSSTPEQVCTACAR